MGIPVENGPRLPENKKMPHMAIGGGGFDKTEMCGKIIRNFLVPVSEDPVTGNGHS